MGSETEEQLWYALWIVKAVVLLSLVGAVALFCKWALRRIAKWRQVKPSSMYSLGTLQPPRKFVASRSKDADLDSGNVKGALDE